MVRDNQDRYYEALESVGNLGESTPFIEYMLEVILNTLIKVGNNLSENQQKIIDCIKDDLKYLQLNYPKRLVYLNER